MSEPLIRFKQIWKIRRYNLLEKILMSYHLLRCYYFDTRAKLTNDRYTQRVYDTRYLNSWLKYKLIFYKVT
jgi:hypothetical protein